MEYSNFFLPLARFKLGSKFEEWRVFPQNWGETSRATRTLRRGSHVPGMSWRKCVWQCWFVAPFELHPPPFPRADKSSHVAYPTPVSHGAYHLANCTMVGVHGYGVVA